MRHLLAVLAALFLSLPALAPVPLAAAGVAANDSAMGVAASPDGQRTYTIAASNTLSPTSTGFNADWAVGARDAGGNLMWVATHGGTGLDVPAAVAASPDGALVAVTGFTSGPTGVRRTTTLVIDSGGGNVQWSAVLPPATSVHEGGVSVAFAADSQRVFVTAPRMVTTTLSSHQDWIVLAYDASTGALLWSQTFGTALGADTPRELVATQGIVVVTGVVTSGLAGTDLATAAFDETTGAQLWNAIELTPCSSAQSAGASLHSPFGLVIQAARVYVAGTETPSCASGAPHARTLGYSTVTGQKLWDVTATQTSIARDVANLDGKLAYTVANTWTQDILVLAYHGVTGGSLWTNTYTTGDPTIAGITTALGGDGRARVYVLAHVFVPGGVPMLQVNLLAYDAGSGAIDWIHTTSSVGNTRTVALATGLQGLPQHYVATTSTADNAFWDVYNVAVEAMVGAGLWTSTGPV